VGADPSSVIVRDGGRSSNHLSSIEKFQDWWLLDAPPSRGIQFRACATSVAQGKTASASPESWPGLSRPPTPCLLTLRKKDVGARDKRGHDGGGLSDHMKQILGVRDAAFSLLHVHLRRQRRADRRLVGPIEMVRACGRRCHRPPCGDQGRDIAASRSGLATWRRVRQTERTTAVG